MVKGKLKEAINIIINQKIVPVLFVREGWFDINCYYIFDTSKELGEMIILDKYEEELYFYKGMGELFHPYEPKNDDKLICPRWFDREHRDERKLIKDLRKYIRFLEKNLLFTLDNAVAIDVDVALEFLSVEPDDVQTILDYKPHPYFKLEPNYEKKVLEEIEYLSSKKVIEYYI